MKHVLFLMIGLGLASPAMAQPGMASYGNEAGSLLNGYNCVSRSCNGMYIVFDGSLKGCIYSAESSSCSGACKYCVGTATAKVCHWTGQGGDQCQTGAGSAYTCGLVHTSPCYYDNSAPGMELPCWCDNTSGTETSEGCAVKECV